jgi:hypothetical protein
MQNVSQHASWLHAKRQSACKRREEQLLLPLPNLSVVLSSNVIAYMRATCQALVHEVTREQAFQAHVGTPWRHGMASGNSLDPSRSADVARHLFPPFRLPQKRAP